jgi:protein O-mannosyl-transferase
MNARMRLPLKSTWWDSMIAKLKAHPAGVQDESSLASLTQCARDGQCALPPERMKQAFAAALAHAAPTARLLATYGDYAWNVLDDHALGTQMTEQAVKAKPDEPAYRITLIRMLVSSGQRAEASRQLQQLAALNIGGRLDGDIATLEASLNSR